MPANSASPDGGDTDGESDGPQTATEDIPRLGGPPELVQSKGGNLVVAVPNQDRGGVTFVTFQKWECQRCGNRFSHGGPVMPGDDPPTLPEQYECESCNRQGPFVPAGIPPGYEPDDVEAAMNTDPIWEPPQGVEEADFSEVWDAVNDYISTYWSAAGREWMYEMLTAYTLSTWFRDELDFLPHLLVQGKHETGKTRLLNTLQEICYRATHVVEASPPYIYRSIDAYGCTMFISEYHRLNEESSDLVDAVVNAGQKRGESIGRVSDLPGEGFVPENFDPFTHVGVSTQFEAADDLKSRCFEIKTKPPKRDEEKPPRYLEEKPILRAKLLYLRMRYLDTDEYDRARAAAEQYMDENDLWGRISEKIWPLLTMAELADRDISKFVRHVVEEEETGSLDTEEQIFIQAVIDQAFVDLNEKSIVFGVEESEDGDDGEGEDPPHQSPMVWLELSVEDICDRFNRMTGRDVSNAYIGQIRNRLDLGKKRKADGTFIRDPDLEEKLRELCAENNMEFSPSEDLAEAYDPDGTSFSQTERRAAIKVFVDEINDLEAAERSRVVRRAESVGLNKEKVRHDIEKMVTEGDLLEVEDRKYQVMGGVPDEWREDDE